MTAEMVSRRVFLQQAGRVTVASAAVFAGRTANAAKLNYGGLDTDAYLGPVEVLAKGRGRRGVHGRPRC